MHGCIIPAQTYWKKEGIRLKSKYAEFNANNFMCEGAFYYLKISTSNQALTAKSDSSSHLYSWHSYLLALPYSSQLHHIF